MTTGNIGEDFAGSAPPPGSSRHPRWAVNECSGLSMKTIHQGRGINQVHFDLVAKYIHESLVGGRGDE